MKQAIQFLSVLLVLVLSTGPAWAALGCASDAGMGSSCPMGMSSVDPDCPMAHNLAAANCSQDCCNEQTPTADVQSALTSKPSPVKALPAGEAVAAIVPVSEGTSRTAVIVVRAGNSPPRYILLRVFRI